MTKGTHYARRDLLLKELGYSSYREYRESSVWRDLRQAVLNEHPECYCCHGTANQVHHLDYFKSTLLGQTLDGLIPICQVCHSIAEFNSQGRKRSLLNTNETLSAICRSHRKMSSKIDRAILAMSGTKGRLRAAKIQPDSKKTKPSDKRASEPRAYFCKLCGKPRSLVPFKGSRRCASCKRGQMIRDCGKNRRRFPLEKRIP